MMKEMKEAIRNVSLFLELLYSSFGLIFAAVMVGIGFQYLPDEERDPCPNGSASWMYIAGLLALVTQTLNIVAKIYQIFVLRNGSNGCGQQVLRNCGSYRFSSVSMIIVELAILIWGSVVVFGAWSAWSDIFLRGSGDHKENVDNHNKNYCDFEPMLTAFLILIFKWSLVPCLIVFLLMSCCSGYCSGEVKQEKQENQENSRNDKNLDNFD